jgi:hypothetical protein
MDARRFDLFARGIARMGSRRSLLRSLALAAGGTVAVSSTARALDAANSAVGGSSGTSTCPPSRRPTKRVTAVAPFPVFIVGGTCDNIDKTISYNLIDAGAEEAGDPAKGPKTAIGVARSLTSIRVKLDDLLAEPYAVAVHAGGSNDDLIACGDIGGVLTNNSVALGLQERNGSGYSGVARLAANDSQTAIDVFVAQDLFELVDSWEGATVVTTIDVNLRDKPSQDSNVVAVLGEGSVLTVTGPAEGEWLPVKNDATGDTGYVSSNYVEIQ